MSATDPWTGKPIHSKKPMSSRENVRWLRQSAYAAQPQIAQLLRDATCHQCDGTDCELAGCECGEMVCCGCYEMCRELEADQ